MPRGHVMLTLSRLARWVGVANAIRPCEGLWIERESVAAREKGCKLFCVITYRALGFGESFSKVDLLEILTVAVLGKAMMIDHKFKIVLQMSN